jgi:hypothetical protein
LNPIFTSATDVINKMKKQELEQKASEQEQREEEGEELPS